MQLEDLRGELPGRLLPLVPCLRASSISSGKSSFHALNIERLRAMVRTLVTFVVDTVYGLCQTYNHVGQQHLINACVS